MKTPGKIAFLIILLLAAMLPAQTTQPSNQRIVADALKKVDQIELANGVIQGENAKLWEIVRGDIRHDAAKDQEIKDQKRAIADKDKKIADLTQALHNRPAWAAMSVGAILALVGAASLWFNWSALAGSSIKLMGFGGAIVAVGWFALIYWWWIVFAGGALLLAAVAFVLRDVWVKHNAGVEIADGVKQAMNADRINLNDVRPFFAQAQGPAARKIVKAATH